MNKTITVEKKKEFNVENEKYLKEFRSFLGIKNLESIRILNVYNLVDITESEYEILKEKLFVNSKLDLFYEDIPKLNSNEIAFRVIPKDGQYNQREDMANEYIKKFFGYDNSFVKHSKIVILKGATEEEADKIKNYYINKVDSKEIKLDDDSVYVFEDREEELEIIKNFTTMEDKELEKLISNFAMDLDDIKFVQDYFKKENREPNIWELKTIDTYWSDHCRHTTFLTEIKDIKFEDGKYKKIIEKVFNEYKNSREFVHNNKKPMTLMDMATINMKELRKLGLLDDMEVSDEINACSIEVKVDVDGKDEDWLLLFKNETHNHPTEIEPYGGAHTCIGGGIRDPLSSRAFVHQAMRITGAKDPRTSIENTLEGKLPQRKICQSAMEGYSDYGNQIGLAGGLVKEIYHDGYEAKRMELGALVAAVPKKWVVRENPVPTDLIVLLGAKTGRDGLGAAVGSSNVQKKDSLETAGAEVQKGNPLAERNIIRLFRDEKATKLIKKCNDFGAGGVAVAVGELADGLEIDLDAVPLKYKGLQGGEIALSESQERMAVVVSQSNIEKFLELAKEENIEASVIARVVEEPRMRMIWRNKEIINLSREFLNSNGARKEVDVKIIGPENINYLTENHKDNNKTNLENIKDILTNINYSSQKGLAKNFDNSIGSGTVLSYLGGKNKVTTQEGMVSKFPVLNKPTKTCSIMTYGYDPYLAEQTQFHGGYYAVIESLARITALGGDYSKARMSFQEFFERLDYNPEKWSKPINSLLGTYKAMKELGIPSIGGKDSMSGTYENITVPPTLVSFAVVKENIENIVSRELKSDSSKLVLVEIEIDEDGLLNTPQLKEKYRKIKEMVNAGKILSASTVNPTGIGSTLAEMAMGNEIGVKVLENIENKLFVNLPGSLILEVKPEDFKLLDEVGELIAETNSSKELTILDERISLKELEKIYTEVLEEVYPMNKEDISIENIIPKYSKRVIKKANDDIAKVLIPILPGTNGEYDTEKAFLKAGAKVNKLVFNTLTKEEVEKSIETLANEIRNNNILVFANGALMGEEVESNGKFLELLLNDSRIKESVEDLVKNRNGLIIGLGAGFIGLVNSGLIEFGEIKEGTSIEIAKNLDNTFISDLANIKVITNDSPWLSEMKEGDIYTAPVATKQGRVILGAAKDKLLENNQVVTTYANSNVTNSEMGIEGLVSPCGRIIGLTGLVERIEEELFINSDIKGYSKIIESGVNYFN
ncbi:phosphoribosylformylglycinamidine synthase [Miniphocaeibacter massiliensis]|uniref:phosphoribosylformylglycinamidine synthase n=1 Tax=Miniphocaeibacter massiliensis TaxID=2041841 RepID=UPI000C1C4114|nr:phosphoribosylformylglycinamidine synthase [Miniphocaeibacter massiliensis]